jgi:hypothetical protein
MRFEASHRPSLFEFGLNPALESFHPLPESEHGLGDRTDLASELLGQDVHVLLDLVTLGIIHGERTLTHGSAGAR